MVQLSLELSHYWHWYNISPRVLQKEYEHIETFLISYKHETLAVMWNCNFSLIRSSGKMFLQKQNDNINSGKTASVLSLVRLAYPIIKV